MTAFNLAASIKFASQKGEPWASVQSTGRCSPSYQGIFSDQAVSWSADVVFLWRLQEKEKGIKKTLSSLEVFNAIRWDRETNAVQSKLQHMCRALSEAKRWQKIFRIRSFENLIDVSARGLHLCSRSSFFTTANIDFFLQWKPWRAPLLNRIIQKNSIASPSKWIHTH